MRVRFLVAVARASLGLALLSVPVLSESDPVAEAAAALDGFEAEIEQAIDDFNVPGLGIAVVAGGEVAWARGVGYRDIEAGLPMTPDTLFAIGSTTKAMTSTLLGILVDAGKLEWDAPLRDYLPTFRLSDATISERITPRDLVTHRSGLPRHDLLWYNNNEISRGEMVARLAHLEITAGFRQKFQYNNLMYLTAGYLAGVLEGSTWEEAMRRRLFEPLGMRRTNFSVAESQQDDDFAWPYKENDDDELERIPFRNIDLVGPAGSVNSSVNEMSRWLLLNLGQGRIGEQSIVNPTTIVDIQSPHMTTGQTPERPEISQSTYGMGWSVDTYRGHRRIGHGGGIDGFITSVMLFPDDGVGIVAFVNRGSGLPSLVAQHATDRVLGLEPIDWMGERLAEIREAKEVEDEGEEMAAAERIDGTAPSHELAEYIGEYLHPGYGVLAIEREGESLGLVFNGIRAPLEHWHYDVFSGADTDGDETFEDQKFLFRGDVYGQIAEVEATLEARAAPIVFRKRPDARLSDPEFLRGLIGDYEGPGGLDVRLDLAGSTLIATLPGSPPYTLEPQLNGRFVLREARVVSLAFELDEADRASGLKIFQPGSVLELTRKTE